MLKLSMNAIFVSCVSYQVTDFVTTKYLEPLLDSLKDTNIKLGPHCVILFNYLSVNDECNVNETLV